MAGSRRSNLSPSEFLEFSENVVVMLHEIAKYSRVTKQFPDVPIRQNEIEVVGAIGFLGDPEFALQADQFTFHQCDLFFAQPSNL